SGMMTPLVVAFVVVLVVNRLYARTQALIDGVFFRARYNAGQALVRLADAMTTTLDLDRLAALITGTIDELLHPGHVALFLANDERGAFRRVGRGDGLGANTVLATCLAGRRTPLSRETLLADPAFEDIRAACLADLDALEADVAVPIVFRDRLTALLVLGARRGGDVNETAGDGLMVIFQDADPRRHARAAVATAMALLHRANDINAAEPLDEPIVLHVGVNSGRAGVGATKIEGTAGTRWTYTA